MVGKYTHHLSADPFLNSSFLHHVSKSVPTRSRFFFFSTTRPCFHYIHAFTLFILRSYSPPLVPVQPTKQSNIQTSLGRTIASTRGGSCTIFSERLAIFSGLFSIVFVAARALQINWSGVKYELGRFPKDVNTLGNVNRVGLSADVVSIDLRFFLYVHTYT